MALDRNRRQGAQVQAERHAEGRRPPEGPRVAARFNQVLEQALASPGA